MAVVNSRGLVFAAQVRSKGSELSLSLDRAFQVPALQRCACQTARLAVRHALTAFHLNLCALAAVGLWLQQLVRHACLLAYSCSQAQSFFCSAAQLLACSIAGV